ncbi:hypothetical protein AAFC00_003581 [Neodothiora populina]|uniref:Uncharacterized protein n=1 Tax=Neodothiora populina TaxID=2781224 RepID=A0ABR3PEQ2_9PEZI
MRLTRAQAAAAAAAQAASAADAPHEVHADDTAEEEGLVSDGRVSPPSDAKTTNNDGNEEEKDEVQRVTALGEVSNNANNKQNIDQNNDVGGEVVGDADMAVMPAKSETKKARSRSIKGKKYDGAAEDTETTGTQNAESIAAVVSALPEMRIDQKADHEIAEEDEQVNAAQEILETEDLGGLVSQGLEQSSSTLPTEEELHDDQQAHSTSDLIHEATLSTAYLQEDLEAESPSIEPPEAIVMSPQRTPAKALMSKELSGMRSTSNKENEQPLSLTPLPTALVDTTSVTTLEPQVDHGPGAVVVDNPEELAPQPETENAESEKHPSSSHTDRSSPAESTKANPPAARHAPKPSITKASQPLRTSAANAKTAASSHARTSSIHSRVVPQKAAPTNTTAPKRAPSVKGPISRPSTVQIKDSEGAKPATRTRTPAEIPHSKPRPVSMSFPLPPAPPKSTRPPTKSNFHLPGEAIAAKLKAAREARLKKEEEERESRRAFKARPVPKQKEQPVTVRHNASSRARQSLAMGTEPAEVTKKPTSGGLSRAKSVRESMLKSQASTSATTGTAAAKRMSAISTKKPTLSARDETSSVSSICTNGQTKRGSVAVANSTKPRASTVATTAKPPATSHGTSASGTKKGKEVFQRAVAEKEALDKQKRDKEEAARKARADAAERGRIASREWAEKKMKLKALKTQGDVQQQQQQQQHKIVAQAAASLT